jgi:hypothetical protein
MRPESRQHDSNDTVFTNAQLLQRQQAQIASATAAISQQRQEQRGISVLPTLPQTCSDGTGDRRPTDPIIEKCTPHTRRQSVNPADGSVSTPTANSPCLTRLDKTKDVTNKGKLSADFSKVKRREGVLKGMPNTHVEKSPIGFASTIKNMQRQASGQTRGRPPSRARARSASSTGSMGVMTLHIGDQTTFGEKMLQLYAPDGRNDKIVLASLAVSSFMGDPSELKHQQLDFAKFEEFAEACLGYKKDAQYFWYRTNMTETGTKLPAFAPRWQSAVWEMHKANYPSSSQLEFRISSESKGSLSELRGDMCLHSWDLDPYNLQRPDSIMSDAPEESATPPYPALREEMPGRLSSDFNSNQQDSGGRKHETYTPEENAFLLKLKEDDRLPWAEISEHFPERSKGTLQVHYQNKLKRRPDYDGRSAEAPQDCGPYPRSILPDEQQVYTVCVHQPLSVRALDRRWRH